MDFRSCRQAFAETGHPAGTTRYAGNARQDGTGY